MKSRNVLIGLSLGALLAGTAVADDVDAEAYIEYREDLMQSAKTHNKAVSNILKGKLSANDSLVRHARTLHELSMMFAESFPEGSDFGDTRAKDSVWSDPDAFQAALEKNQTATAALVTAVQNPADSATVGDAVKAVGKSCKGCHKKFRSKD